MNEVFSKVVTLNSNLGKVLGVCSNAENLGEFLMEVSDDLLPRNVKDHLKYDVTQVVLDIPGFKSYIKVCNSGKENTIKYDIDFPGLKEGVLYIQVLPVDRDTCKMRLAGGYNFSLSPAGLYLRSKVSEEKIVEALNDIVESFEESFNTKEKGEG